MSNVSRVWFPRLVAVGLLLCAAAAGANEALITLTRLGTQSRGVGPLASAIKAGSTERIVALAANNADVQALLVAARTGQLDSAGVEALAQYGLEPAEIVAITEAYEAIPLSTIGMITSEAPSTAKARLCGQAPSRLAGLLQTVNIFTRRPAPVAAHPGPAEITLEPAALMDVLARVESGEAVALYDLMQTGITSGMVNTYRQKEHAQRIAALLPELEDARQAMHRLAEAGGARFAFDGTITLDELGIPDEETLLAAGVARDLLKNVTALAANVRPIGQDWDGIVRSGDDWVAHVRDRITWLEGESHHVPQEYREALATPPAQLDALPGRIDVLDNQVGQLAAWMNTDAFFAELGLDRQELQRLADSILATYDRTFTGRNAMLKELTFVEPADAGFQGPRPLLVYALHEAPFNSGGWWIDSASAGPNGVYADVTSATSRSPLRSLYGDGSRRQFAWTRMGDRLFHASLNGEPLPMGGTPGMEELRYVINYDGDGRARSAEMMFFHDGEWHPFFMVNRAGRWLPAQNFHDVKLDESGHIVGDVGTGRPVEEVCIKCHATERGGSVLSPLPYFLNTADDLRAVGYQDEQLIQLMLQYGEDLRAGEPLRHVKGSVWEGTVR